MIKFDCCMTGLSIKQSEKCNIPFLWWKGSTIYHVPVRYFHDFNKDAYQTGDIRGVEERIDYMSKMGVQVVSLSEFMPHADPKWQNQQSFVGVDERVGDIDQFQSLVQVMKPWFFIFGNIKIPIINIIWCFATQTYFMGACPENKVKVRSF